MAFVQDGYAAVDWLAGYRERVQTAPVLARLEPGQLRSALPDAAPEEPAPFARVLEDLDEIVFPGLSHWQSPRFFAYFSTTGSAPGVLAGVSY